MYYYTMQTFDKLFDDWCTFYNDSHNIKCAHIAGVIRTKFRANKITDPKTIFTQYLEHLTKFDGCYHEKIHHNVILEILNTINPNLQSLQYVCQLKDKIIIEKIVTHKIKPDQACFTGLISGNHWQKPANDAVQIAELIDLIILYGYQLTTDDVINAVNKGYYVNNIKRFNFNFDDKLIEACYASKYFPYPDLNLKPSMECLRKECRKTSNIPKIKELVKQGLKPDLDCLRDACKRNKNFSNIKYLVTTCKIKPDFECIKNIAKGLRSASLDLLIEEYDQPDDKKKEDVDNNSVKADDDNNSVKADDDNDDDSISEDEKDDKNRFTACKNCKAKFKTEKGYKEHMRRCNIKHGLYA